MVSSLLFRVFCSSRNISTAVFILSIHTPHSKFTKRTKLVSMVYNIAFFYIIAVTRYHRYIRRTKSFCYPTAVTGIFLNIFIDAVSASKFITHFHTSNLVLLIHYSVTFSNLIICKIIIKTNSNHRAVKRLSIINRLFEITVFRFVLRRDFYSSAFSIYVHSNRGRAVNDRL